LSRYSRVRGGRRRDLAAAGLRQHAGLLATGGSQASRYPSTVARHGALQPLLWSDPESLAKGIIPGNC